VPTLAIDREGNFGIGGDSPMRVSTILAGLGVDIDEVQDMVRLYALGYGDDLDVIGITVDPARLELAVDRETALEIMWDEELRGNLLGVVEGYYPIPDIPFIGNIFPDWKTTLINAAVGTGWGQWGLELEIVDEVPASGLERTLQGFGLLR
jgi:hypothetical protein